MTGATAQSPQEELVSNRMRIRAWSMVASQVPFFLLLFGIFLCLSLCRSLLVLVTLLSSLPSFSPPPSLLFLSSFPAGNRKWTKECAISKPSVRRSSLQFAVQRESHNSYCKQHSLLSFNTCRKQSGRGGSGGGGGITHNDSISGALQDFLDGCLHGTIPQWTSCIEACCSMCMHCKLTRQNFGTDACHSSTLQPDSQARKAPV